jgi:AcrR family transcriptional regulator
MATESTPPEGTGSAGIPWWPAARSSRRGAAGLSREQIAAAALTLLDTEGVDAVSMRRIAQALDVGTMSLYWHVPTKGDLLAFMVDLAMSVVELPDRDADWIEQLRQLAWNARRVLDDHPAIGSVLHAGVTAGPALLRITERALAILRAAGFDDQHVAFAFQTYANVAVGFAVSPAHAPAPAELTQWERERWTAGNGQQALDPSVYPTLVELAEQFNRPIDSEYFSFALEATLAGLRTEHARLHS